MSGVFTTATKAGEIFGSSPRSAGVVETGQRPARPGGGPPASYRILLQTGGGYIRLQDDSGDIALQVAP